MKCGIGRMTNSAQLYNPLIFDLCVYCIRRMTFNKVLILVQAIYSNRVFASVAAHAM